MSERIKVQGDERLEEALLRAFTGMSRTKVKTMLRDSRVKAVIDLAFDSQPRFYGPRVEIGRQEPPA